VRASIVFGTIAFFCCYHSAFAQEKPSHPEERVSVPAPTELALERYRTGNILWFVNTGWELLVPCFFLFSGLSARLRDWAHRIGRRWFFVLCTYFILFTGLTYVLSWPLNYYQGFIRAHAYGLSNQTFARWQANSLKGLAIEIAAGCLFLWIPYLLIARSPRRWWLYTALLLIPFAIFAVVIAPVVIDPVFNDFHPMENHELEGKILALAERAGIEGSRVYVVDKSVDTKQVNAYVTGLGGTKRIVLWDTLLHRLNEREILFIVGHEMGHYVLHHVLVGTLVFAALAFVGLFLVDRGAGFLLRRFSARFGFNNLADVASLPLLLLGVNVAYLVLIPFGLAFSRHIEHEADRFGLEITQDNRAAAESFVALQNENLSVPWVGRLYTLWRASHPSLGERIEFCNDYRPWENGEPLRYGGLFKEGKAKDGS
jgi:Zn-dependent protease with chaperone function